MTDRELAGCALLPCPFCGGAAKVERFGSTRQSTIYTCTECGCTLETGEVFRIGERWNSRVSRAPSRDAEAMWREAFRHRVFNEHIHHGSPITVAHASACTAVLQVEARIRAAIAASKKEG